MTYFWNQSARTGLCALCLLIWPLAGLAQNGKALQPNISPLYPQVLQAIEQLEAGEDLQVFLATEKDTYVAGEPFEARFAASAESYVALMRITTDGTLMFLTPNRRNPEGRVQGNVIYSTGHPEPEAEAEYHLGLDLMAAAPPGSEVLNLFCSPRPMPLFDAAASDAVALEDDLYVVRPDDEAGLQAVLTWLEQFRQTDWAGVSVAFLVEPFPTPAEAPAPASAPAPTEDVAVPEKSTLFEASPLIPDAGTLKAMPRKFGALRPMGGTGTTGKMFPMPGTNAADNIFTPEQ